MPVLKNENGLADHEEENAIDDEDEESDYEEGDEVMDESTYLIDGSGDRRRADCSGRCGEFLQKINSLLAALVDVDNIWDDSSHFDNNGSAAYSDAERDPTVTTRRKLIVLFWFLVLASAYAGERASFKILVDQAGPFRLLIAQAITGLHAIFLGIGMLISAIMSKQFKLKPLGIPIANVGLMAILDTVYLLLAVVSAYHVPAVQTVILVQLTIPLTVCITQCQHYFSSSSDNRSLASSYDSYHQHQHINDGNDSYHASSRNSDYNEDNNVSSLTKQHLVGASIMLLAALLTLSPDLFGLVHPSFVRFFDSAIAWNSLLFAVACVPAAVSTRFKEGTLMHYRQHVDTRYLNFLISLFQFFIAMLVYPLLYSWQGFGVAAEMGDSSREDMYPAEQIPQNFVDGARCFVGTLDEAVQQNAYAEPADCGGIRWWVVVYVVSIMLISVSVDKIVHAGATNVMYRGLSAGLTFSVGALYFYEYRSGRLGRYGELYNVLLLSCTMLLIVGSEVYHRVKLPDTTFETVYPRVESSLYYDD